MAHDLFVFFGAREGDFIPRGIDLDRDVPPEPQNPYSFLRVIFATTKKRYPFLRIFLKI